MTFWYVSLLAICWDGCQKIDSRYRGRAREADKEGGREKGREREREREREAFGLSLGTHASS